MHNWTYTLDLSDVFHGTLTFTKRRNEIVKRIKASKYYRDIIKEDLNLDAWTRDLAGSKNDAEFNEAWEEFYETADRHSCWVVTR